MRSEYVDVYFYIEHCTLMKMDSSLQGGDVMKETRSCLTSMYGSASSVISNV